MKLVDIYANFVNNHVEKSRNEVLKYMMEKHINNEKIIKDYDQLLLNSYLYIEKLLEEEEEKK